MIIIKYDKFSEMMQILQGDEFLFEGNYWDFDATPLGLERFLDNIGVECTTTEYTYE